MAAMINFSGSSNRASSMGSTYTQHCCVDGSVLHAKEMHEEVVLDVTISWELCGHLDL